MGKNKIVSIGVEGIDGAGKSTAIGWIEEFFKKSNISYYLTREPGGNKIAEQIRNTILNIENKGMDPVCEALLYSAARAELLTNTVYPQLNQGKTIIFDRFAESTIAYQGYGRGLSIDLLNKMTEIATQGFSLDKVFIFDLNPEIALERVGKKKNQDRLESEKIEFFHKVRNGYLEIAKSNPEKYIVIDASKPIEVAKEELLSYLNFWHYYQNFQAKSA